VKVVRAAGRFQLHFGQTEKVLLLAVLNLYPRIPSAHQPLSKSAHLPNLEANQRMLDEALAEQRAKNKKQLDQLLANPRRVRETETGLRVSLSRAEIEWLLQILNDIRVGSWIILGSPEDLRPPANEGSVPHYLDMEMAGYFQAELLQALEAEQ
jgi:hypothetical protein